MDPRTKSSVLWGLVGGLSFLVLVQGYQLLVADLIDPLPMFGVAMIVAAAAAMLTYLGHTRLPGNESP